MRTVTLLLTVLTFQMSAAYIPSTVYVQRNPTKTTEPEFAKGGQTRDTYVADASSVVASEGESQTLTTATAAEVPTELYVLTPATKQAVPVPPMRNCCISGK